MASGLTSGMTSGTPSVMRKALELSTTVAPAAEATAAYFLLMEPPAEKRAMSTPLKLEFGRGDEWVRRLPYELLLDLQLRGAVPLLYSHH